jgi:hypothetical protein
LFLEDSVTRKTVARWFLSGTPGQRFVKEALTMLVISFAIYCILDWKDVVAHHFTTEDLWVTALCNAIGFGLVAAMNGIDSQNQKKTSQESASTGLSSKKK